MKFSSDSKQIRPTKKYVTPGKKLKVATTGLST